MPIISVLEISETWDFIADAVMGVLEHFIKSCLVLPLFHSVHYLPHSGKLLRAGTVTYSRTQSTVPSLPVVGAGPQ